jgi:hypothetical protein
MPVFDLLPSFVDPENYYRLAIPGEGRLDRRVDVFKGHISCLWTLPRGWRPSALEILTRDDEGYDYDDEQVNVELVYLQYGEWGDPHYEPMYLVYLEEESDEVARWVALPITGGGRLGDVLRPLLGAGGRFHLKL